MDTLTQTAARLEALGSPTRLGIYRLLVRAGNAGLPVGSIQERTGIPASTLSHHLKYLQNAGLILRDRVGTAHFCRANYEAMNAALQFLTDECCAEDPDETDQSSAAS